MLDTLFAAGGILCQYKVTASLQLRRKFKEAETKAKLIYDGRTHQEDSTGDMDESTLPSSVKAFFDYFDWVEEIKLAAGRVCQQRIRNVVVNRSIIGQQPTVTTTDTDILNDTAAEPGRERGTGEIAGDIIMNEINEISQIVSSEMNTSASDRTSSINPPPLASNRRTAPNDGQRSTNRPRNYNMQFEQNLPPSTGSERSINIDRMEQGYTSIAESINNLAYQQRIRRVIDINDDLQRSVQLRVDLMSAGSDNLIVSQVEHTISDLEQERDDAREYQQYVLLQIRTMYNRSGRNDTSTSRSDGNVQSDGFDNSEV